MERSPEPPQPPVRLNKLQTVTLSAVYNIVLQISLRLVTFISNAFILRYISKDILGLINVRLLLLYTTVQFTSREAFRRSCAPKNEDQKEGKESIQWSEVVNVTSLTVPISLVLSLFFGTLWYTSMERPEEHLVGHYWWGIVSITSSVVIELLAESCYIYGQRYDYIRLKVVIEGIFQLVRCLLLSLTVALSPGSAILGFALAQLTASTIYTLCYFGYFIYLEGQSLGHFLPYALDSTRPLLNASLLRTARSFFINTLLKQFLTEGERYVMTIFAVISLAEQGIYDAINNLGSLPARLIFQQIEENAYLLFSSLVKREVPPERQKAAIIESVAICAKLVRFMFLLGLVLFVYGFNCAQLALFLYGGPSLVAGPYGSLAVRLLQWHCFYILFIALNGILESFSFAAMNVRAMTAFNYKMLALSGAFLVVSWRATAAYGSEGFIIANCINMALRIAISVRFIGGLGLGQSAGSFTRQCTPDLLALLSFGVVFFSLDSTRSLLLADRLTSEKSSLGTVLLPAAFFVATTGALLLVQLLLLYYREAELVRFIRTQLLRRSTDTKAKTS